MTVARQRPLPIVAQPASQIFQSSGVVAHVLDELKAGHADLSVEDLLQGRIHVNSTVDARAQRIVSDALQHGLQRYEQRHLGARGLIQGSVVVLKNRDGSILAEVGGREMYRGRARPTASKGSRSPSGSGSTTIVRSARRKPGPGGAAGVSGTDAEGVSRQDSRACAAVSTADGTTHRTLREGRSSARSEPGALRCCDWRRPLTCPGPSAGRRGDWRSFRTRIARRSGMAPASRHGLCTNPNDGAVIGGAAQSNQGTLTRRTSRRADIPRRAAWLAARKNAAPFASLPPSRRSGCCGIRALKGSVRASLRNAADNQSSKARWPLRSPLHAG
jgi:hypothetical protein